MVYCVTTSFDFVCQCVKIAVFCIFSSQAIYIKFCLYSSLTHRMLSFSSSDEMGTQGSGRKRAPLKDRFSAEDEALSSIAREVS